MSIMRVDSRFEILLQGSNFYLRKLIFQFVIRHSLLAVQHAHVMQVVAFPGHIRLPDLHLDSA
jgi:hypothetical protein